MVVYKTTNLVNGKQYIGKDIGNKSTYLGSGVILKKAIKKYGKENFKKEILEVCSSHDELKEREEYWLNYYDAGNNPMFYNRHNYSYGHPNGILHSDQSRRKMSKSHMGKTLSPDHIRNMKNSLRGRTHSEETKQKIGSSNRGKTLSEETKQKMRDAKLGKTHSDETKKKISILTVGKFRSEETKKKMSNSRKGKNLPEETKKKISDAKKGKTLSEETRKKISDSLKQKKSKLKNTLEIR